MEENDTSFPLIWSREERASWQPKGITSLSRHRSRWAFFLFVYILHKKRKKFLLALKWRNNR